MNAAILRVLTDLAKLPVGPEKQMMKRKLIEGVVSFTAAGKLPPPPTTIPPPPPQRALARGGAPASSSYFSSSSDDVKAETEEDASNPTPTPPTNALGRWRKNGPSPITVRAPRPLRNSSHRGSA